MPEIIIIAAVAKNGVIGKDNQLLWHIPEDMKHFREVTAGKPVIMGRKTWESLPERFRPLPGRRNIVITRQSDYRALGAETYHSVTAAIAACAQEPTVCVIGGGELYKQALPLADTLNLTKVDLSPNGDAFFPSIEFSQWQETSRTGGQSSEGTSFEFVTYKRKKTS